MTGTHRVRRLRWRVRVGSREQAFAARLHARQAVEARLLPLLDEAFARAAPPDRVVHLPQLVVSLRVPGVEEIDALPLDVLAAQIADQLRAAGAERRRDASVTSSPHTARASGAAAEPDAADWAHALRRYLRTGRLPWHLEGDADAGAGVRRSLADAAIRVLPALVESSPRDPAAIEQAWTYFARLLALLPDHDWTLVIGAVARHVPGPEGNDAADAATVMTRRASGSRQHRMAVVAGLAAAMRTVLDAPEPAAAASARARLAALVGWPAIDAQLATTGHAHLLLGEPDAGRRADTAGDDPRPAPGAAAATMPVAKRADLERGPTPGAERADSFSGRDREAVMVGSAGLILLAPFLPQLFAAMDLLEADGRTWRVDSRVRAVAALLYAATGSDEGQEFELAFVKVLAGLRPDSPLPYAGGTLGAAGRQAVDELLQAVIGHWQALGRTSAAGLRSAFLQRPGALREDDMGWQLQVHGAAHDVLLDRLPWGIGTVMLPWVSRPLFTEWTPR